MFIVIDGSALLTTHYYGSLPVELKRHKESDNTEAYKLIKNNEKGIYVNGVESALYSIFEIIKNNPVDKLVVCFDKSRNTFRRELYSGYKANRPEKPIPLKQQFDTLQDILNHIGIKTLVSDKYEADDLAGSVIEYFKNPFENTYFITKDHDWFQLIDDSNNVKGLIICNSDEKAFELRSKYDFLNENNPFEDSELKLPTKMVCFDEYAVQNLDGVKPCQIPDKKGFAGDKSDNIPGIFKVGDSTAISLLSKFETMDDFYSKYEEMDDKEFISMLKKLHIGDKTIINLIENKNNAMLSRQLALIIKDCNEISLDYNDYNINIDYDLLRKVIKYYHLDSLERFL